LPSGRDAVLKSPVLGLPRPIDEQPAEQARTGADAATTCRVPPMRPWFALGPPAP